MNYSDKEMEHRGTFVGTVNYMAPEMIKESESTLATDLWALGCMIFKMYTGKVPFPGMSEMACFPNILNRQIDWPKNIEIVEARSLKQALDAAFAGGVRPKGRKVA